MRQTDTKVYDFTKSLKYFSRKASSPGGLTDFARIYPVHVRMEVTEICNLRCNFCIWHDAERNVPIKNTVDLKNRYMNPDRLEELIDEMSACGVRAVSFTGTGDPLVYPYMPRALKRLHARGIRVGVTSNFSMPISDELIEQLTKNVWVRWSQNAGTAEAFQRIHNPKNKSSTIATATDNVARLIDAIRAGNSSCNVNSSVVVNALTKGQIGDCVALADRLGLNSIQFRPDVPLNDKEHAVAYDAEIVAELKALDPSRFRVKIDANEDRDEMAMFLESQLDDSLVCYYSGFTTYVAANFDVYPCCYTRIDSNYVLGNLAATDFKTFWEGKARQDKFREIKVKNCPKCPHVSENVSLRKLSHVNGAQGFTRMTDLETDSFL